MNRLQLSWPPERTQHLKWALIGITLSWTLAALMACATPAAGGHSLYQQLGGPSGVDQVVGRTLDRMAADSRTKRSFQGVKMPYLKKSVAAYICKIANGLRIRRRTMANSHAKSNITASEFDLMVSVLQEELDRAGASEAAKMNCCVDWPHPPRHRDRPLVEPPFKPPNGVPT